MVGRERRLVVVAVIAVLSACSDSEGRDDDDGATPRADSSISVDGGVGTDAAMRDAGGEARDMNVDPPDTSTTVDSGTTVEWASCEEYQGSMGATPGDRCDPATFGNCGGGDRCCTRTVSCSREGTVLDETVCLDGCGTIMNCPGYVEPGSGETTCRTEIDCAGRGFCLPPGESAGCGPPPIMECATDADCAGDVVERICTDAGPCGGTQCVAVCTTAGSTCPEDTTCNTASGHCDPISCEDGWVCPASAACSRGLGTPDEHGCARRDCMVDLDCDCGACVRGFCYEGPGVCTFPPP